MAIQTTLNEPSTSGRRKMESDAFVPTSGTSNETEQNELALANKPQNNSQAAIVRGAAIRGLEGTTPSTLICRRHYGFQMGVHFKDGVHDEKNAYWSFGEKLSRGYMTWMISKVTIRAHTLEQACIKFVDQDAIPSKGDRSHKFYSCQVCRFKDMESGRVIDTC